MISKQKVKQFCNGDITKIENYDKAMTDTTQTWHCHHKLEIHDDYRNTIEDLILMNLYYNRPPEELIFLTPKEHSDLHKIGYKHSHKGGFQSEEKRQKISKANKGKKRGPLSEEHKIKLSKSLKGRVFTEEWKRKISEARKGKKYKKNDCYI